MESLNHQIEIKTAYTRSINLERDGETLELVRAYLPTTRALQALHQVADGLGQHSANRALALVGPYGAGKSAFALFLGALLSPKPDEFRQTATAVLSKDDASLARRFAEVLDGESGFLRVQVNGIPDSLIRQLLLALASAGEKAQLDSELLASIRGAAHPGTAMDRIMSLFRRTQSAWADAGGCGVLVEIDELGKFLEYESYHPQHREIHLLQLLAEHAQTANRAPLYLLVMLHQAFEHYSHRLGKNLREEWQKVQGRFSTLSFLEPVEQSLRIVGAAFQREGRLPDALEDALTDWATLLAAEAALPTGLEEAKARKLFSSCYPLHPVTLLILPVLCHKLAQNERTLFSYLGSSEPFGLRERLGTMSLGDWIEPWQLYDYFMLNPASGFSDPLTYHRWAEVATALARFDGPPDGPAAQLLKTVGLLNLIGAQRGLKASRTLLEALFGEATGDLLAELESASVIHLRQFNQEYRVWQGSDFDLGLALRVAAAEYAALPLVDTLNKLAPIKPIVARRVTIETGSLRSFAPRFTDRAHWPPKSSDGLTLWFYLKENQENPKFDDSHALVIVAVCDFTERLREAVSEWMALQDLPKRHAELQQDPVAQREHRAWLESAEAEAVRLLRTLLGEPESLEWHWGGEPQRIEDRRHLQRKLSEWVENQVYSKSPKFRNELVNRDQPSPSANTGRKRLLAAMLVAPHEESLGIAKTPAEKSLYLSLLKESKLHRAEGGRLGFYPPIKKDPCRLRPAWDAMTALLGDDGAAQVPLTDIYAKLKGRPFGVMQGVLPVLIVAYLLANRREVALYQEGVFCEALSIEQAELLCRRPELFALERFDIGGLRGELFDRYIGSVVGKVRHDASLLDIVRPLTKFMKDLPEYTQHCPRLSAEAKRVREALQQAVSPGVLLFDALPKACGIDPAEFGKGDVAVVESLVQTLVEALRELHKAYPRLLDHWQAELNRVLLDVEATDLGTLRKALAQRYQGLEDYTPDRMGVGALARRLADAAHEEDRTWLESVATLLGRVPPAKWREDTRLQAELRLREMARQLRDLETLRLGLGHEGAEGTVLLKLVDVADGETSRVLQPSAAQWAKAKQPTDDIAVQLERLGLDEVEKFAVLAGLMKRFTR